jgi:hypothetical protein
MTRNINLATLSDEGVSIWLDDLSREQFFCRFQHRAGNDSPVNCGFIGFHLVLAATLSI